MGLNPVDDGVVHTVASHADGTRYCCKDTPGLLSLGDRSENDLELSHDIQTIMGVSWGGMVVHVRISNPDGC